ncbi:unnamed protein product [Notodromas monacha]|uniref:tRNA (cytosine(34)-C(5))-methyltransferase n=1 Tax=Notodromas monacha TaxID=399045 RepID=A0A7R9BKD3_9CRUS|nr:unnamed protein product [Notodromas monacha]CAG0916253.1 unnamed protein product [Notodromas monacha]
MGRRNRKRNRDGTNAAKNGSGDGGNDGQKRPEHYEEILRENQGFNLYYKTQKVIPEDEWDNFIKTMATNLPVAFRITGFRAEADILRGIVKDVYLKNFAAARTDDGNLVIPKSLPWYPRELAWQVNLTRQMIRRDEVFAKLHHFLISETVCGAISRQEAVSMIPPLVLDVQPNHKVSRKRNQLFSRSRIQVSVIDELVDSFCSEVLDMCAAPGSKTTQLLEMLYAGDDTRMSEGMVVANDADNKRCYMLVTQAKRLNSPNLVITNHDASVLPKMTETGPNGEKVALKFDRVLCDVPCSGDGTMRKNVDVWKKWNGANGNNLHWLQFRIARRGLELLKPDGIMVYSTCSLNPIEDEAILCRLLKEYPDCLEIIDVADKVPGLRTVPGVTTWKPMSRDLKFYENPEEIPEKFSSQIRAAMFPPSPEEAAAFHLDRCMRILPHHQDTGGFFLAAIRKLKPLRSVNSGPKSGEDRSSEEVQEKEKPADVVADEDDKMTPPKKRRFFGFREDPFIYFNQEEPCWKTIKDFFGVEGLDHRLLLSRNREEKKKNLYLTCAAVKDFIDCNQENVKVINTGIKAFIRCDGKNSDCEFRLAQEVGVNELLRFLNKRVVKLQREDALAILRKHDLEDPLQNSALCDETQEALKQLSTGSVVFVYETKMKDVEKTVRLALVGWKGAASVRAYVAKSDRVHLLRLCGGDTSYFENLDIEAKFGNKSANGDSAGNATQEEQDALKVAAEEIPVAV